MNPAQAQLQKVAQIINESSAGIICVPENPSADTIAAATSLYIALQTAGKNMAISCATSVQSTLIAADRIQAGFTTAGENLVVAFPYTDGAVDKVDYFIQNDKFHIVVTPGVGFPKLNPQQVAFGYAGGTVDFVITVDATSLKTLGALYTQNQDQFKGKKIINIDRHLANSFFGTANLVNKNSSSNSEYVLSILQSLSIPISKEIASNLYAGILAATNNFTTPNVTAQTFEITAYLMKAGAGVTSAAGQAVPQPALPKRQPATAAQPQVTPTAPNQVAGTQTPRQAPRTTQPMPQGGVQQAAQPFERTAGRALPHIEKAPAYAEGQEVLDNSQSEEEWLKPNIFKSDERA
jgi:hypothetical protein